MLIRVADSDLGSSAFLTPRSGLEKIQDPGALDEHPGWDDSGSGPDLVSAVPFIPYPSLPPPCPLGIPGTRAARVGAWVYAPPRPTPR